MLRIIVGVLLAFWIIGLLAHIAGGFIYTLLAIAVIVFIYDSLVRSRSV